MAIKAEKEINVTLSAEQEKKSQEYYEFIKEL